jgi:DNA-binding MarR family transcriptional regulator
MALRNAGTLSQAALGRAIGMERPNVHGLLARLHAMHLIETAPHPTDQRAVQIALSPTGAAHADDIARISAASASETLRPLAPAERELFLDLLARVAAGERHL